jgi:hypothetical protein
VFLTAGIVAVSPTPARADAAPLAAEQVSAADVAKCPVRAGDLDKLTQYRWQVGQYQANRSYSPAGIRIDMCELIGRDAGGSMKAGVMVNVARGATAAAFAKHWHDACANSLMPNARGKVQPVPGTRGGQQCVTASGKSSNYWIESATETIQIEPENEDAAWAKILPQLMAAMAK